MTKKEYMTRDIKVTESLHQILFKDKVIGQFKSIDAVIRHYRKNQKK